MKDRCPLERLWLSSWGQLAARLAAAPPGAAAAPGPAASRDASAQVLCGFGARRPPSWTPARPQGQDDVMTAMRPMVRWALPGGLVAVVVATIALGPLVQAGAAGDVPEPGAGELLAGTWLRHVTGGARLDERTQRDGGHHHCHQAARERPAHHRPHLGMHR